MEETSWVTAFLWAKEEVFSFGKRKLMREKWSDFLGWGLYWELFGPSQAGMWNCWLGLPALPPSHVCEHPGLQRCPEHFSLAGGKMRSAKWHFLSIAWKASCLSSRIVKVWKSFGVFTCSVCNRDLLRFRPQIAVRLLAHKIQSPQEWEAVQALTVGSPYPFS